jgi:Cu/Ag efflux protein CusF
LNKKHTRALKQSLIFIPLLIASFESYGANTPSVLDPGQHPDSPEYESLFNGKVIPLDEKLSWIDRFNGDETFNAEQTLNQALTTFDSQSSESMTMGSDSMSGMKMDGTGTIKSINLNQGKVKISHGPIDKYGMPAMTMVFKVEDPSQLQDLKDAETVGFNVDNSSGGFVLTQIMSMSDGGESMIKKGSGNMDAIGEVETIRSDQGKIKIKHGPIDKYGMPAMTMMFKVTDPSMLDGLKKNQQIGFNVDNSNGGFLVTQISPMTEMESSGSNASQQKMDAQGVVQTIRLAQGKVKIKHGPIDKYGMPAMTMMFQLSDPTMLDGIKKGSNVNFEIDNSSGGFVITNIVSADQNENHTSIKQMCFMTGPFIQKNRAVEVRDRYLANDFQTELKSSSEKKLIGIMVFLPSHETRQNAEDASKMLAQQGISDSMIINEPGKSNALSLGIFGLEQNANRLMMKIKGLNREVESEPRYQQQAMFWIYSQHAGASEIISLLDQSDVEKGISQISKECS